MAHEAVAAMAENLRKNNNLKEGFYGFINDVNAEMLEEGLVLEFPQTLTTENSGNIEYNGKKTNVVICETVNDKAVTFYLSMLARAITIKDRSNPNDKGTKYVSGGSVCEAWQKYANKDPKTAYDAVLAGKTIILTKRHVYEYVDKDGESSERKIWDIDFI